MRINKALALAKIASRRGADALITSGRVSCNGSVVLELGLRVTAMDTITVDGKRIDIPYENTNYTYIIMNKPVRYISSVSDPQGRDTVLSLLTQELRDEKVYPIGRLDYFSEGLLLLSNDGNLTYTLTHPKYHVQKEYKVTVRSKIDINALKQLHKGYRLTSGEELAPMKTRVLTHSAEKTVFSITLRQGINRQIRKICADMGWVILQLERIRIGRLSLENILLPRGQYRIVDKKYITRYCL